MNNSPYTIEDLSAGTTYTVAVYGIYPAADPSTPVSLEFTTDTDTIIWPEATEVNLRAEAVTATAATLPWNEVSGATEYHLADGKGFEQSVTAATYGLTGLSPNTTYTFTLIASNATHSSTYTVTTAPRWHL